MTTLKDPQTARKPASRRRRWPIWVGGTLIAGLLLCVGAGVGGWFAIRQRFADQVDTRDLDARLAGAAQQYLATRPQGALVIGVVQHGRTAVFGFGHLPDGSTPTADTVYEIGSLSKVLTGLMLADMVVRGEVARDDRLGDLIPSTLSDDEGGTRAGPAVSVITLEQLVTHTSGLPRLPAGLTQDELASADPYAAYSLDRLWQDLAAAQLENAPGVGFAYSNFGAGVLGQVLALRSGLDYADLVADRVLVPLALADTTLALSDAQRSRLAPGFVLGSDASAANWDLNALAPAGGFKSTATDLTTLIAASLAADSGDRAIDQALVESRTVLYKGWDQNLAYGWIVQDQIWGQRVAWHNGGTGGYTSYLAIDFEHDAGIVLLSNYGDAMAGNSDLDSFGLTTLPWIARVSLP